jgi:DNA-directed RNA polymerase sigma subunit (sigma70/sigma32)
MKPPPGTSIIDVRDPAQPRVVATIKLPTDGSHTHKVRVVGDVMIVNVEQNDRHAIRRGLKLKEAVAKLSAEFGRTPSEAELARALKVPEALLPKVRHVRQRVRHSGTPAVGAPARRAPDI